MEPTHTGMTQTRTRTRPSVGVSGSDRPRMTRHVRLAFRRTRHRQILPHPEPVAVLTGSGADILELADG